MEGVIRGLYYEMNKTFEPDIFGRIGDWINNYINRFWIINKLRDIK